MGLEGVQDRELGDDVHHVWDRWTAKKEKHNERNSLSKLAACWWAIWKVKNDLIFCNIQLDPGLVIHRLKLLLKSWEVLLRPK